MLQARDRGCLVEGVRAKRPSTRQPRGLRARVARAARGGTWLIAAALPTNNRRQTLAEVRRSEFAITDTDDNAIAAAAIIGDKRSPVIG